MVMSEAHQVQRVRRYADSVPFATTKRIGHTLVLHVSNRSKSHRSRLRGPSSSPSAAAPELASVRHAWAQPSAVDKALLGRGEQYRPVEASDKSNDEGGPVELPNESMGLTTNRFLDSLLEKEYYVYQVQSQALSLRVIMMLASLANIIFTFIYVCVGGDFGFRPDYMPSIITSITCLFVSLVTFNPKLFERTYRVIHPASFLIFETLFIFDRRNFLISTSGSPMHVIFVIMVYTMVIRRDYFITLLISSIITISLIVFTVLSVSGLANYRVISLLLIGTFFTLCAAKLIDINDRRMFISQRNIKILHRQALESRSRTKQLLQNIYPEPVCRDLTSPGSDSRPCYRAEKACVMIIQLDIQGIEDRVTKDSIRITKECYKYVINCIKMAGLHRIKSRGQEIMVVSGLFGEGVESLRCIENGIKIASSYNNRRTSEFQAAIVISIGIGEGWLLGGIIDSDKRTFDIMGEAYEEARRCLDCKKNGEVIISQRISEQIKAFNGLSTTSLSKVEGRPVFRVNKIEPLSEETLADKSETYDGKLAELQRYEERMSISNMSGDSMDLVIAEAFDVTGRRIVLMEESHRLLKYAGILTFVDQTLEEEYKEFLRTKLNWVLIGVCTFGLFLELLLYGLIYFSLYEEAGIGYGFSDHGFLLGRFYVTLPVIGLHMIMYTTSWKNIRSMETYGVDGWRIYNILLHVSYFTIISQYMVMTFDQNFLRKVKTSDLLYLPTEAYEWAIFSISSFNIPPLDFGISYTITVICGVIFFVNVAMAKSFPFAKTVFYIFQFGIIPVPLIWVCIVSRDYTSRKTFLFKKIVSAKIRECITEKDRVEEIITSVISSDTFKALQSSQPLIERLHEGVFLTIHLQLSSDMKQNGGDPKKLFEKITDLYIQIENVCRHFDYEVLQIGAYGCTMMSKRSESKAGLQEQIEKAIRLGFELPKYLSVLRTGDGASVAHASSGISIGECLSGIIGKQIHFEPNEMESQCHDFYALGYKQDMIFDVIGDSVRESEALSQLSQADGVYISRRTREVLGESQWFQFHAIQRSRRHQDRKVRGYEVSELRDVWGMFLAQIDWMNDKNE